MLKVIALVILLSTPKSIDRSDCPPCPVCPGGGACCSASE